MFLLSKEPHPSKNRCTDFIGSQWKNSPSSLQTNNIIASQSTLSLYFIILPLMIYVYGCKFTDEVLQHWTISSGEELCLSFAPRTLPCLQLIENGTVSIQHLASTEAGSLL